MQPKQFILQDIQQLTHDLASTLRLFQQHYGSLPASCLASSLLVSILDGVTYEAAHSTPEVNTTVPSPIGIGRNATVFGYMQQRADRLFAAQRYGLSRNYHYVLASFRQFRQGCDLYLSALTSEVVKDYEMWLFHHCSIKRNTSSFYLRQLRAVYNHAVAEGLVIDLHPFANVYTGIDKTAHRALTLEQIRAIKRLDLSDDLQLARARDLFMFSFYTQGMSFVDMAFLKKNSIIRQQLTYVRHKSHQTITLHWEPEMTQLVDRLWQNTPEASRDSPYLLPILTCQDSEPSYQQYRNLGHRCNKLLHVIGLRLNLPITLTMYVARHSWATGAYRSNMSVEAIGAALGHSQGNERITRIYLDTIDCGGADTQKRSLIDKVD